MKVTVSNAAARHIRERGGTLYIWLRDPGWRSVWWKVEIATERPQIDVEWQIRRAAGVTIRIDAGIPLIRDVRVALWPWPRRIWVEGVRQGGGN